MRNYPRRLADWFGEWLGEVDRPAMVVAAGALVVALIGQCYAHQEQARVEQLHRKAQRAERQSVEWQGFYADAMDTLYACQHPGWWLDTMPRRNLTVDPDGTYIRTTRRRD